MNTTIASKVPAPTPATKPQTSVTPQTTATISRLKRRSAVASPARH